MSAKQVKLSEFNDMIIKKGKKLRTLMLNKPIYSMERRGVRFNINTDPNAIVLGIEFNNYYHSIGEDYFSFYVYESSIELLCVLEGAMDDAIEALERIDRIKQERIEQERIEQEKIEQELVRLFKIKGCPQIDHDGMSSVGESRRRAFESKGGVFYIDTESDQLSYGLSYPDELDKAAVRRFLDYLNSYKKLKPEGCRCDICMKHKIARVFKEKGCPLGEFRFDGVQLNIYRYGDQFTFKALFGMSGIFYLKEKKGSLGFRYSSHEDKEDKKAVKLFYDFLVDYKPAARCEGKIVQVDGVNYELKAK